MSEKSAFPYARFNSRSGRAMIVLSAERVLLVQVNIDGTIEGPTSTPEGLHLGMWLQPADSRVVEDIGTAPEYLELKRLMRYTWRLNGLVNSLVYTIEGSFQTDVRQEGAQELEDLLRVTKAAEDAALPTFLDLADREARKEFLRIALETEISQGASTRDLPELGELGRALLNQMIARWGHRPT